MKTNSNNIETNNNVTTNYNNEIYFKALKRSLPNIIMKMLSCKIILLRVIRGH